MSYIINKTDGSILVTLQDGTTDNTIGLSLIGRDYPNYGELQNENFVRLLENFASEIPPGQSIGFAPITGTLWWDTGNQKLKIYNGTTFVSVSPLIESATAPMSPVLGDQWWDTVNDQLKSWSGTAWITVGPLYTRSQGVSGPRVETLIDNTTVPHTVVTEYVNGNVVSVSSRDSFILRNTTYGFSAIQKGINLPGNKVVEGNAYVGGFSTLGNDVIINGQLILSWLNGLTPQPGPAIIPGSDNIYDIGSTVQKFRNFHVGGNLVLTDANISFANKSLIMQNKNFGGNVEIYVNATSGGNVKAVDISGSDGLVYVAADPTRALGVVTKQYADAIGTVANATANSSIALTNANVAALQTQLDNSIINLVNTIQADVDALNAANAAEDQAILTQASLLTRFGSYANLSFSGINSSISTINSTLPALAPLVDPSFSGNPTSSAFLADSDNSTSLATTAFVTKADDKNYSLLSNRIDGVVTQTAVNLAAGVASKADLDSPAFVGTPTVPTPTTSASIVNKSYVDGAISAQRFNYTVSTNSPSGGNDGDFWFQIG